jgi:hypothetical protein
MVGTGNSALTMWSLTLGALAKQQAMPVVPQALAVVPGEILVAGSGPQLLRYRFSALDLEPEAHPVDAIRSVYGLQVQSGTGTIVAAGAGGVELLSSHGARLGAVWHTSAED